MPQSEPLLSISGLHVSFPAANDFEAVKDVSFALQAGKTLAIVGESGSGKSLIALTIIGLAPKNANIKGNIDLHINEKRVELNTLSPREWNRYRGSFIGIIFQEPMSALNPVQCVGKQIKECIALHQKLSAKKARSMSLEWIEKVKIAEPEKIYYRYPHQLSGGQKQRIMIAMAMCNGPKILLADEPTTALDVTVQQEIVGLMKSLQEETQTAMIFISHDLALAGEIADDILVMNKGRCVEYAQTDQILFRPNEHYTKALLSCRPNISNKGKKLPIVSDYLSGDFTAQKLPLTDISDTEEVLQLEDLNIWYPEGKNLFGKTTQFFKAVKGVSFAVKKGETIGLVGESGCGKSSIGKSLLGLVPITSGKVLFRQQHLETLKGKEWNTTRKKMQLIFQDPYASLDPRRTIAEIITEPIMIHQLSTGKKVQQDLEKLLDMVQLPKDAAQRYPHQFSGGQRQRVSIARALALQPQLLICDESVSALDVSVQAQILNLLKELQYELKLSYLFISHDLSVVHYMSDQILVMQQGQIIERGSADAILLSPKEGYTQKLIAAMPVIKQ